MRTMAAMKTYVIGGLVFLLILLFQAWPWPSEDPEVVGLLVLRAGIIAFPTGLALGTVALLLGLLQVYVALHEGVKLVTGVVYLVGAAVFSRTLYLGLAREGGWPLELTLPMSGGLSLLMIALLVNLVGIVRFPPKLKAQA